MSDPGDRAGQARSAGQGVTLHGVVIDETGAVVGVGRSTRVAPGWLADAAIAVNGSCTGPCCRSAARVAALDHARPWQPTRPDHVPGTTDVANLAPLCTRQNRTRERDGWQVIGTPDGGRLWRHERTGVTYRHLPDHTIPPPASAPQARGAEAPTVTDIPATRARPDRCGVPVASDSDPPDVPF